MSVIQGATGNTAEVGEKAAAGVHVIAKPTAAVLGHYRIGRHFTPFATTLAGNLWAFRWSDATRYAVIQRIHLRAVQIASATAAIEDLFNAKRATGYTVSETTAATAITPTTAMQAMRSSMGDSVAIVQEASAAAGLSGGTRTLDTIPFVTGSLWVLGTLATAAPGAPITIFDYKPDVGAGEHPLVLGQNEGFLIANENNFGAAQGLSLHLEVDWAEVAAF